MENMNPVDAEKKIEEIIETVSLNQRSLLIKQLSEKIILDIENVPKIIFEEIYDIGWNDCIEKMEINIPDSR